MTKKKKKQQKQQQTNTHTNTDIKKHSLGPDMAIARAAAQYQRENLVGSCNKAGEFFADTSSLAGPRDLDED